MGDRDNDPPDNGANASPGPRRTSMDEQYLVPTAIPCVYHVPSVFPPDLAATYYATLHSSVPWERTAKINRWVALYEDDPDLKYRYRDAPAGPTTNDNSGNSSNSSNSGNSNANGSSSGSSSRTLASCPAIDEIRTTVQNLYHAQTGHHIIFTACLLNYYEDGQQRIGWHADREEIGRSTPIASVSLGATRTFLLRHKLHGMSDRATVEMESGDVLYMENVCQVEYLHSVPRQADVAGGRINLTFRCKAAGQDTKGEEEHDRRDRWLERITAAAEHQREREGQQDAAYGGDGGGDLEELLAAEIRGGGGQGGEVELFGDNVRVGTSSDKEYDSDGRGKVRYAVSCNVGTEPQCAAEIREKMVGIGIGGWDVVARPYGIAGYVGCLAPDGADEGGNHHQQGVTSTAASQLLELRSALHVLRYHDHFGLEDVAGANGNISPSQIDGEMMYAFYKKRLEDDPVAGHRVPTLARATADHPLTFRVTCDRTGDHPFRAPTIEYEMGGACSEAYPHCRPQMTDFDVHLRIDVVADRVLIGTQLNVEDLSRRHFLRYRNSVTIKTNVAYIMLRLADVGEGSVVLDPFCGSGTILLEALEMTNKTCRCIGMDVNRRAAEGAGKNALAEGYGPEIAEFHCTDARGMRRIVTDDRRVDAIVSNMPWGVRTGQNQSTNDLQQLYETFLRIGWYVLKPGGRIVMLVLRGLQVMRILRKLGGRYRILKCMVVRTTNNLPCILVVEKVERDLLHESVKSQLAYMSQFVNVSKEMYQAINNETIDEAN